MIYLDISVALAQLLFEDRRPPDELWGSTVVSSRLLEYELWTRLHARGLAKSHGDLARGLLARVALVELVPPVLVRALEALAVPVRTLGHSPGIRSLFDRPTATRRACIVR